MDSNADKDEDDSAPMDTVDASAALAPEMQPAEDRAAWSAGLKTGERLELTSTEEGLVGSWYGVEVMEVGADANAGKVFVKYVECDESEPPLWVDLSQLRPMPPPTPDVPTPIAWTKKLVNGDGLQLYHEQGWWDVQYLSRSAGVLRVVAKGYNIVHEVYPTKLRPAWQHNANGEWEFALGGISRTATEWSVLLTSKPAMARQPSIGGLGPSILGGGGSGGGAGAGAAGAEAELPTYKWGVAVEVLASDGGCWGPAEVLKEPKDDALSVAYIDEAAMPPNATISLSRVRPAPPLPPAGWAANLRMGEAADVFHEEQWWEGTVESRKGSKAKVKLNVPTSDPTPLDVRVSQLRPRFHWLGWEAGWEYESEGRRIEAAPGPMPPMAHNLPSSREANEVGQTKQGRVVVKPKAYGDEPAVSKSGSGTALAPAPTSMEPLKMSELLEVEVAEEEGGQVSWKPAEVVEVCRAHLCPHRLAACSAGLLKGKPGLRKAHPHVRARARTHTHMCSCACKCSSSSVLQVVGGGRFKAMVNGESDFIEEFGEEDQGTEWRRVAASDIPRVRKANEAAKVKARAAEKLLAEQVASCACAYACACTCACACACAPHVCMRTPMRLHACAHACACMCPRLCMHVPCASRCARSPAYMCACSPAYVCACTLLHMCACAHGPCGDHTTDSSVLGGRGVQEAAEAAAAAAAGEAPPKPKSHKRKADESVRKEEGRPPKPLVPAFHFGFGMEVEVRGLEAGYESSWYSAEILQVKAAEAGRAEGAVVVYEKLFEGEGGIKSYQEEVNRAKSLPQRKPPLGTAVYDLHTPAWGMHWHGRMHVRMHVHMCVCVCMRMCMCTQGACARMRITPRPLF